jgi:hypothetical protein
MAKKKKKYVPENERPDITRRLIAIRIAMTGDNQREFADLLDIAPTRWNNMETGSPLSRKVADKIVELTSLRYEPSLSYDYLYKGKFQDTPKALAGQLQLAEVKAAELQLKRRRKGRRKGLVTSALT